MTKYTHKPIPLQQRLILALDTPNEEHAIRLINELGDTIQFYKLGLELLMGGQYFQIIKILKNKNKKIFADLKFYDVPRTVKAAIKKLNQWNVDFTTVHGNDSIMKAAADSTKNTKILAVTALTSLDNNDIKDLGFNCSVNELVITRTKKALELGCSGVISSGLEAPEIRKHINHKLIVVTPGIRPENSQNIDDQKRTVNVTQAFNNGADYIVIGRPILQAKNPCAEAHNIQQQIKNSFAQ